MNPRATALVVVGCGGHGREVAAIARAVGREVIGFLDDAPSEATRAALAAAGTPVLGGLDLVPRYCDVDLVVGIADGRVREEATRACSRVADALVHPDATVADGVRWGPGTVVWPGARISIDVTMGQGVHVNQNATIGHDAHLADFVTVNPSAAVSGTVSLATRCLVGAGSVVLQGRRVGADAVVGASACVTRDVAVGAVVTGVPAS